MGAMGAGFLTVMVAGLNGLVKEFPDDEALREELRTQVRNAEAMAVGMFHQAARSLPEAPPPDQPINPYAVGLDPKTWEADGLFDSPGLTVAEAQQIAAQGSEAGDPTAGGAAGPPAGVG